MSTYALGEPVSMRAPLPGRLIGALVILVLLLDGVNRLVPWPAVAEAMDRMGYGASEALERALGAISMPCLALTSCPPTSIVGAILWTGYFGDVLVAHLKMF